MSDIDTTDVDGDELDVRGFAVEGLSKPDLARGDHGPHVTYVQTVLGLPATGNFNADLEAAVRRLQAERGFPANYRTGQVTHASKSPRWSTWQLIDDLALGR